MKHLSLWRVTTTATIEDVFEDIEAETAEEACEMVNADWTFVEASSWQTTAEPTDVDDEMEGTT